MDLENCKICGQSLNLFSKDRYTGQLCFSCFQAQAPEWQKEVADSQNNQEALRHLLEKVIPTETTSAAGQGLGDGDPAGESALAPEPDFFLTPHPTQRKHRKPRVSSSRKSEISDPAESAPEPASVLEKNIEIGAETPTVFPPKETKIGDEMIISTGGDRIENVSTELPSNEHRHYSEEGSGIAQDEAYDKELIPPPCQEHTYYESDMGDDAIEKMIDQRLFIMERMKYYAEIPNIEENYQLVQLDMIRHQLAVMINQNELIIRLLKRNTDTRQPSAEER